MMLGHLIELNSIWYRVVQYLIDGLFAVLPRFFGGCVHVPGISLRFVCVCVFIKLHITAQSGPVIYSFYATGCNPPGGYLS